MAPQMRLNGPVTGYRIKPAAELIGVSDDTLRRWIDAGRITSQLDEAGRQCVTGEDLAVLATECPAP